MNPKSITSILFILIFIVNTCSGQKHAGDIGLVLMENFSSDPINFGFSYWFTNQTSVEFIGGFENTDLDDNSGTLYNLGLGGLYHFGTKKLVPFVGGRFLYTSITSENKSYSDLLLGVVFGAEYFFSEWISLGGEFQFNYIETDKEFSPSQNVADATIIKTERFVVLRFYL
jgi:hypothetical protein